MSFSFELTPFEDRGVFLGIPFEGETDPTVLFVAARDFEQLVEMAEDPGKGWTELRDELFELLEHSGHDREHRLGRERTEALRERLRSLDRDDFPSPNGQ